MKLTLVIASLGVGGAERVLSELANYWVSKQHDVIVITLGADAPFYPLSPEIKLVQLDQILNEPISFFKRFTLVIKRTLVLRKAIVQSAPDVVVSFVDVMNVTTLMACVGTKIPVVVSERIDPHFHQIPRFYKFLRTIFYPYAKKIVVQTKSAAAYFKNQKNVIIVPNAVKRTDLIVRDFAKSAKNIISVGRLCKQKDFKTLIKAFAEVHQLCPQTTLTIYGESEERSNLEKLIQLLNLNECVRLPGAVTEIDKVLSAADLFVFPSLYEGFPNALCEAMTTGLPVIASNCSGNIDIVQDHVNGRLFAVGDVKKLTELISELILDQNQCQKLSLNATKISEKYNAKNVYLMWDKMIQNIFSVNKNGK